MTDLKIVIAGDRAVGRTKLYQAISKGQPLEDGAKIYETCRPFDKTIEKYSVHFWDTPSEDRVRLRALNYPSCNCILLCFSLDNPDSFKYITTAPPDDALISARALIEEVQDILTGVPIILVGSKMDQERKVSKEEIEELRGKIKAAKYMEFHHKDWASMEALQNEAVKLAANHAANAPKDDSSEEQGGPPVTKKTGKGGGGGGPGSK